MMGPYWPVFTDPKALFKKFKEVKVNEVFTESFNAIGGNWTGVEKVLKNNYPKLFFQIKETLLNKDEFYNFYSQAREKIQKASKKYGLPVTVYFKPGHAGKFK